MQPGVNEFFFQVKAKEMLSQYDSVLLSNGYIIVNFSFHCSISFALVNFKKNLSFVTYILVFTYTLYKEDYTHIAKHLCPASRTLKEKKSLNDKKHKKVYLDNECQ